jgi:capsid protein
MARSALGIRAVPPPPAITASQAMRGRVGRWDSKNADRMNQAHWQKASGLPINAELAYASNWLRAQSEYEISSNPVIEGLVNSHITDVVGPEGPSYRVTSSCAAYNQRRERIWREWARQAGANCQLSLVEILAGWVRSLWKAGEFGTQLINDAEAPGPIKMRLLPVHMHRLLTPPEMLGDPDVALGVRRDKNRNPISYFISEPYIFGPFEVYTGEFYEVRYEDFVHGFEMTEEDQCRGVPWLATSLDVAAQIRDWDKSMLDAAETLSKTGVLWTLKNPESPMTVNPGTSAPMERGQHTFGPMGWEPEQVVPTQPSSDQQSFRAEKKAEIGRGRCIPSILVNLDSSGSSYASCRFDNQPYWRSVAAIQGWLGRIGLDRIEATVIREAELAGELEESPHDAQHHWGWIKPPHVDPTKEATAERTYLQNGTLPYSDAVLSHGNDPDRVLEIRQRDAQRLKKAELPPIPGIPDPSKAAGAGAQVPGAVGETKKTDGSEGAGSEKEAQTARTADLLRLAVEFQEMVGAESDHAPAV